MSIFLAALVFRASYPTPFQDELLYEPLYASLAQGSTPALRELLAAHHGHTYFLLKSLIAFTLMSGLPWTWLMYAQVAVLSACAVVVIYARGDCAGWVALGMCLLVLLSPRQWENLYWAMQLAFPLYLFFSLVAFSAADRYGGSGQPTMAWLALGSGLLASVSNGAGVFSLALTCLMLFILRPDRPIRIVSSIALIAGVALFTLSQVIGARRGIGDRRLDLLRAWEHAVRMMAHQFGDGQSGSGILFLIGVASIGVVGFVVWRIHRQWRTAVFELLCIALSLVLVAGVSYSRVSAGHFQPDAPRYLPLLAPLTIGTALLSARLPRAWLLYLLCGLVAFGYIRGAIAEWRTAPYRKLLSAESHRVLCEEGKIHPMHNIAGVEFSNSAIADIRTLFCKDAEIVARQPHVPPD